MKNFLVQAYHNTKLRFLFVGGSTAAVYFSALFLLHEKAGLSENVAVAISYFTSTSFHFLANKFFVHQEKSLDTIHPQVAKYLLLILINYGITWAITNAALKLGSNVYVGVLASVVVTLISTFVIMKRFIFRT